MSQHISSRTPELIKQHLSHDSNSSKSIKPRLIVKFGICFCCLFFVSALQAQTTQQWFYVVNDSDNARFFVQKKIDSLEGDRRGMWTKIVYSDWSWKTGYDEWNCKKRRFRTKQVSSYSSDGKLLRTARNLKWVLVTPEAVSEALYAEACGKPLEVKYAVIISAQAELREFAEANGKVIRTIKRGEKFPLSSTKPVGEWYQIYDPQTLAEYWLHGDAFKIE